VLCSSRHCVDEWQRLARREVRLYLENPSRLKFVATIPATAVPMTKLSGADGDFIVALRQMIFNSRQGECLSMEQLQAVYLYGKGEMLTTTRLGHIVSCRACLDRVNRLLDLPLLAERYQANDYHPNETPSDGDGGGMSVGEQKISESNISSACVK